jgi:hypothetical protein
MDKPSGYHRTPRNCWRDFLRKRTHAFLSGPPLRTGSQPGPRCRQQGERVARAKPMVSGKPRLTRPGLVEEHIEQLLARFFTCAHQSFTVIPARAVTTPTASLVTVGDQMAVD